MKKKQPYYHQKTIQTIPSTSKNPQHPTHPIIMSLKPHGYSSPKDINLIRLFLTLKSNLNPSLQKKIELSNSSLKARFIIINKIKHFITKYKVNNDSLFLSIYLLDTLLSKKIPFPLEKVALGAFVISVKFTDIDGKMPIMNMFREISDYSISLRELVNIEIECIKRLNYNLTVPFSLSFIQVFLVHGIIFSSDKESNRSSGSIYAMPYCILDYVMSENTFYFQFNQMYLACSCVALAREIYGYDKWNMVLEEFWGVGFKCFKEEYEYVKRYVYIFIYM
jgi:hypothetical protein